MTKETESKEAFVKRFAEAVRPSEFNDYKAFLNNHFWSLDQSAALMAGLNPDCYKNGKSIDLSEKEYKKRAKHATQLFRQLLDDIEKGNWRRHDLIPGDDAVYVSALQCIKWIAEHSIKFHQIFFDHLPLILKELFFEFIPVNSALRTASRHSRAYHEAYYLDHAQKLIDWSSRNPSPMDIYKDSHMQDVQRYIRELGGNYKKRTIVELWLPKLQKRSRGRPKKAKTHFLSTP
jgi:hypothetical protein